MSTLFGATAIAITSHHTVLVRIASVWRKTRRTLRSGTVSPCVADIQLGNVWNGCRETIREGRHAEVWPEAAMTLIPHGATPTAITTHHIVQLRVAGVPQKQLCQKRRHRSKS